MAHVYCGIDQSLNGTGIVLLNADGTLLHARRLMPQAELRGGARLSWIYGEMEAMLQARRVAWAAHEDYSIGSTHRAFDLGEVGGVTKMLLHRYCQGGISAVAPTALKKYATSRGSSDKQAVMDAVRLRWKQDFSDDNIADAYVLAQIARCMYDTTLSPSLTRPQLEVLKMLRTGPISKPRRSLKKHL